MYLFDKDGKRITLDDERRLMIHAGFANLQAGRCKQWIRKNEASAKSGTACWDFVTAIAGNDLTVCLHCISGILPDLLFHVFRKPDFREENLRGTGQLQRTVWFQKHFRMVLVNTVVLYSTVRQSDHGAGQ